MTARLFGPMLALMTAAALGAPAVGAAAPITQSQTQLFTISPISDMPGATFVFMTGTFQNFNPALGTLTGVSLAFSGPASITLTPANGVTTDEVEIEAIEVGGAVTGPDNGFGNFTIAPGVTPFDFLDFGTGTGGSTTAYSQPGSSTIEVLLSVSPRGSADGTAVLAAVGPISETLTYTYTPNAAAVPEPMSLALLAIGLGASIATRRRVGRQARR